MLHRWLFSRPASSCLLGTAIRRSFSTNSTAEAFLQPVPSNPAVACLFLNRPQSKNAISTRMLQVSIQEPRSRHSVLIIAQELRECLDNVKFDKRCAAVFLTPMPLSGRTPQCSHSHNTFHDAWRFLCRCRPHRTAHHDARPGQQVPRRSPFRVIGTRVPAHADHRRDRRSRTRRWPRAQLCLRLARCWYALSSTEV